ncbi:hypothetical protein SCA03_42900 [Streptomyces cacaoi]|uniref:Uncharacterized protein n=1 Tax=Streptomyces cacaoi TaxID=1898 RepID=A0A4Y3R366_STRCI|nr:hypothetical protein SCA03_42900 [Streptomyces cacaoi]
MREDVRTGPAGELGRLGDLGGIELHEGVKELLGGGPYTFGILLGRDHGPKLMRPR